MDTNNRKAHIYKNSIEIPLHGFNYLHHTHSKEKKCGVVKRLTNFLQRKNGCHRKIFFGRVKELKRIKNILESESHAKGAYLITGYRGCGKTSFINEALREYKKGKESRLFSTQRTYIVKLNLSNDMSLDAFQVYKRMAKGLLDEISVYRHSYFRSLRKKAAFLFIVLSTLAAVIIPFLYLHKDRRLSRELLFPSYNNIEISEITLWKILNSPYVYYAACIIIFYGVYLLIRPYKHNAYGALKNLIKTIENERATNYSLDTKSGIGGAGINRTEKRKEVTTADIEYELNNILNNNIREETDVIFIFDELDKVTGDKFKNSEHEGNDKSVKLDKLLGSLKNIISENPARFIFIGGRDMHDAYLSQSGAVSSLYQSIFNDSIYIPSLLSDESDEQTFRINSMIEKLCMSFILPEDFKSNKKAYDQYRVRNYTKQIKVWWDQSVLKGDSEKLKSEDDSKRDIKKYQLTREDEISYILDSTFILRNFIHYLTINSKGNYKIFLSIFDSFVRRKNDCVETDYVTPNFIKYAGGNSKNEASYYLRFDIQDIQKILLSSNLYISFHYNLSRRLRHADDKIVIASISMLQFIIRFYNKGFSRRHLYNMYEVVNNNRPPELKGITEILLKNVLTSSLRKSRYCVTRYRFTSLFENEIRYVSETSPDQSAAYNFSLDSLNYIKDVYKEKIGRNLTEPGSSKNALYYLALGDFYYWEQSYDDAINAYISASELLRSLNSDIIYSQTYIDSMLKLGLIFETRHNYSEAQNVYLQTNKDAAKIYNENKDNYSHKNGVIDAKLDYLTQSYWAWLMLNIKRSPKSIGSTFEYPDYIKSLYLNTEEVLNYKTGIFFYYKNKFSGAREQFKTTTGLISDKAKNASELSDRNCFLVGRSMMLIAFCDVINSIKSIFSDISIDDKDCKRDGIYTYVVANIISISRLVISEDIEKLNDELKKCDDHDILMKSILRLQISSAHFKKSGLDTNSVSSQLAIVIIWGFFLEILPWRLIKEHKLENGELLLTSDVQDGIDKASDNIEKICIDLYKESIKTHQKSFAEFIDNHCNVDLEPLSGSEYLNISPLMNKIGDPISMLKALMSDDRPVIPRVYWQRSLQGQYITELYLWQKRASQNFANKDTKGRVDLNINKFPQFGVRSFAIVLDLSARNQLNQLKKMTNTSEEYIDFDEVYQLAGNAIFYFYRATLYVTQSSGNEQEMSFPLQSLIYYNIWETLFDVVDIHMNNMGKYIEHLEEQDGIAGKEKVRIKDFINCNQNVKFNNKDEFWTKILGLIQYKIYPETSANKLNDNEKESEVPYSLCSLKRVEGLAKKHLYRTSKSLDPYGKAHLDVLFEKYYLNDDFDDPTFITDNFFYKAFAKPAVLHHIAITESMKALDEKLKDYVSPKIFLEL